MASVASSPEFAPTAPRRRRWPLALAAALLLAGSAASLWVWRASADFLAQQADEEFDRFSELSFQNISQRLQHQLDLLAGFQALFRASSEVSREEFHSFYNDQRVQARFPGLLAVQYARLIDGHEREAYEARMRDDRSIDPAGYPDFRIHPPGERARHLVVSYIEPMRGNEAAFGHDNLAEAARREVVERARDSGQPQASAPVRLLQQQRPGVLVRLPVFRRGLPTDTLAQRRLAYIGQVSGALLVEDLLRDTLPGSGEARYQVKVTDDGLIEGGAGTPRQSTLVTQSSADGALALWSSDATPPSPADRRVHSLAMAGRQWTIQVARPHVNHALAPFPLLLLGGGLSITLLLALLATRLVLLQHRAQGLALTMSAQARAHAERLHAVFNSTVDGILTIDRHGTVLSANQAALTIFGQSERQLVGHNLALLMPPGTDTRLGDWLTPTAGAGTAAGPTRTQASQARRADGTLFPVELGVSEMQVDGERQYVALVRDLSEAQATQARIDAAAQALRAADELREAVFRHAAFALIVTDALGTLQALNPAAERLLGCRAADEVGQHKLVSFMDLHDRSVLQALLRRHRSAALGHDAPPQADAGRGIERTVTLLQRDGGRVAASITVSALHDNQGQVSGFLAIAYDVTERQRLADQLSQLAYHDGLTGLPNRLRLEDRLQQAIAQAGRRHEPLALLFIDLDRFKPINDTHGHAVGDQVLCEVARRLQTCLRSTDLVARLGGDEFVVLLTTLATQQDCLVVADKLMLALGEPMQIGALTLQVGASMGVARYPEMGNTAAELLRSADAAMYQAKQAGRSTLPLKPLLLARPGGHADAAPRS